MINVVAAIIMQDDKYYICQRKGGVLDKKWEFPGGKIEENETKIDALTREIKEELEIKIDNIKPFAQNKHHYETFSVNLITYTCTIKEGIIKSQVHMDERWIKITEFDDFDFAQADIPIIELLKKG